MGSQVISTIQLLENDKVVHTITIDSVLKYKFTFSSYASATLSLTIKQLNMHDLDILVNKPFDAYVVMGLKRTIQDGQEQNFKIPARLFKHIWIKENGHDIKIKFFEK